jgi:hypothetical protein
MNKIKIFIDKFLNSEEIRSVYFTPHSPIAFRFQQGKVELLGGAITPNGSQRFFLDFLGEAALQELKLENKISKEIKLDHQIIAVEGFLSEGGVSFILSKKENLSTNIDDYPQMVSSFLNAQSGLIIGVNKKTSEIGRVERELFTQKLNFKTSSSLYFRAEKELPFFNKDSFVMNVEQKERSLFKNIGQDIDLVRYGLIQSSEDIKNINSYLSSGCLVMAHLNANKVSEALVFMQSLLTTWEARFLMSQHLIGFYSFINWVHGNKQNYAFEAYPFGPESRTNFYSQEPRDYFSFFEKDFKNNGLSYSQSLHTKVLKRSIDLRKAFELAPDPSDLDYILKKSGL